MTKLTDDQKCFLLLAAILAFWFGALCGHVLTERDWQKRRALWLQERQELKLKAHNLRLKIFRLERREK